MSTSETIITCNASAIALLRDGEISASAGILTKAIKEQIVDFPTEAAPDHQTLASQSTSVRGISVLDETKLLQNFSQDNYQLFDFYPRAFEVPSGASSQRAAVILLYNLALTFDITSLLKTDQKVVQNCHQCAIGLYFSALKVVRNSWEPADVKAMRCVMVATANNLGRLQSLRCSFVDSKRLLTFIMDQLSAPNALDHMDEEDHLMLCASIASFVYLSNGDNAKLLSVAPSA